ncbi:hypothetical protein POM88_017695 [Heracleum sosnowskyi]|uniref:Uncharacterized protein n=1 Tax=Heracleum sosnowskyi TaxID=360622 RepID=A0AAD8ISA0_9APIA|nr:hypothetical protein POM88_017695 [Heracleum sosnowskyi]
MSNPNDDFNIDDRQNKCHRKFEKIVNQFDEMIQVMDEATKPPKPKRRRNPQSSRSRNETRAERSTSNQGNPVAAATTDPTTFASGSNVPGPGSSNNPTDMNGVLVNVITRHLNDLKTDDHLIESSTSTARRN